MNQMLKQIQKQYPESNKLIRHADRDKIPAGSFGNEVMLIPSIDSFPI
jgi:hypothetical protein